MLDLSREDDASPTSEMRKTRYKEIDEKHLTMRSFQLDQTSKRNENYNRVLTQASANLDSKTQSFKS